MIKEISDFHTHTFLSDGVLSPIELIRSACVNGYKQIALTDHVSISTMERVIKEIKADCRLAEKYWGIKTIVGVELTHVPAGSVAPLAKQARAYGAELVVVHGETIVEPVEPGTNRAAVNCLEVDILAHPGLITLEETEMAARNGVFLELTSRRGHSLTNGHVVSLARKAGAELLINSDTHEPGDLHTPKFIKQVGLGAGLTIEELSQVVSALPLKLLHRVLERQTDTRIETK